MGEEKGKGKEKKGERDTIQAPLLEYLQFFRKPKISFGFS